MHYLVPALDLGGGGGLTGIITASDLTPDEGDTLTLTFVETSILGTLTVSDLTPDEGDTLTLEFTEVAYTYQWKLDGSDLSNGGDISGATTNELSVANFEDTDNGTYSVVVTNSNTGLSRTFSKTVTLADGGGEQEKFYGLPVSPTGNQGSAVLDGTTSLLSTTETLTSGLTNATLCGWIKPSAITSFREIFSGLTSAEIEIRTNGGRLQIINHTTGPSALLTLQRGSAATLFNLNQWYHIACVKQGRIFRMYIDGAFHAEGTSPADSTLSATQLRVGSVGAALRFAGSFADFRIYSVAIDDFRTIINRGTQLSGLIAHWPFSSDANDISGNDYNLTATAITHATDTGLHVPDSYDRYLTSCDAIYWSPYNWYSKGGALTQNNIASDSSVAISNTPGAYFKTKFSGSTFGIQVAPYSLNDSDATDIQQPAIEYSIDGGPWMRHQLLKTDRDIVLSDSESDGEHTIEVIYTAVWATIDKWTDPVGLHITGFFTDAGEYLTAPAIRPNIAIFYGDSHAEGHEVSGTGVTIANQNARLAWPKLIADALNAEYGVAAFAGQGYTSTTGLIGDCEASWNLYSGGRSRLVDGAFSPQPDYIISGHGDNDSDNTAVGIAVDNLIEAWRAAAPDALIFLLSAPNLTVQSGIAAGFASASDANSHLIATGTDYLATPAYVNGTHLSEAGQIQYAADNYALISASM